MRARIQFPLTEQQQELYNRWIELVARHNSLSLPTAEADVSFGVHKVGGWKYWATDGARDKFHFCVYPTLNEGWYGCMSCWVD